jgi:hypothetical protein
MSSLSPLSLFGGPGVLNGESHRKFRVGMIDAVRTCAMRFAELKKFQQCSATQASDN